MSISNQFQTARNLLDEIEQMLKQEQDCNWLPGVRSTRDALEAAEDNEESRRLALKEAFRIWRSVHGGSGSFDEYFIWRDDFDERQRINRMFSKIRDELWKILKESLG